MNRILRFLRNLDKRKLIFILQRASAVLLPIRPYPECGRGHCPCPAVKHRPMQGIAIGDEVTIGAGSTLMINAKDGHTYLGCPAKKVF